MPNIAGVNPQRFATSTPNGPWRNPGAILTPTASAIGIAADVIREAPPAPQTYSYIFPNGDSGCLLRFYGVGADASLIGVVVREWSQIMDAPTPGQWTYSPLWRGYARLSSSKTGVSGGIIDATMYYADALTTVADATKNVTLLGGVTAGEPATLQIDAKAGPIIEVLLGVNTTDIAGGTAATSGGMLWKPISNG